MSPCKLRKGEGRMWRPSASQWGDDAGGEMQWYLRAQGRAVNGTDIVRTVIM